ncbi:MAG TPA: SusC/RagA family TonB-linked outer membrane protein [Candidatus Kapabacteria bacterium]|nr:SusC/RagA family TonB-linked outer membrane protein [Candidatus Kapabacteria bacterium]
MGISTTTCGSAWMGSTHHARTRARKGARGWLPILLLFCATGLVAQEEQKITGTVTDATSHNPIAGATVILTGTNFGAVADRNGKFTINRVPVGSYTVEARAVGFTRVSKKTSVAAGQTATVNFELASAPLQQNEIVVLGLSGETDRKKLGNVIGSVEGTEVAHAVTPNAIDAISGRVTGVQVTRTNGVPGAGTYITIRGRKTISGGSEPLYVVDGTIIDNSSVKGSDFQGGNVQMANRAVDINPSDIESIEILKGASAAAIYGSRAANGVVIITTKRGRARGDKLATVTLSSSVQTDNKVGSIPLQTIYGQTTPYQPGANGENGTPGSSSSWGAKLDPSVPTYQHDQDVFRTGVSAENTLTVSGAAGPINYLATGTWTDMQGFVVGSSLDRRSVRFNLGAEIMPKVYIQSNSNYISIANDLPQNGSNTSGILLGSLRTPPEFDNKNYLEPDGVTQRRFGFYDNPVWTENNNTFTTDINRFIHSSSVDWSPLDWLSVNGRIGLDRYDHFNVKRLAVQSAGSANREGEVDQFRATMSTVNADLSINANKQLTDNFGLNVTLGSQTIWENSTETDGSSSSTLPFFDEIQAGSARDASSSESHAKTIGLFAQVTGTLNNRLSLTLAMRRDGSSTFGVSEKYHYYPKVSAAYTISDEPFMESSRDLLSNLRLRGSYGEAGSPTLPGAYATNFLYGTYGFPDPWDRPTSAGRDGFIGIRQSSSSPQEYVVAGNDNISPELSKEVEAGLDLGLFDNRIGLEFTYYKQNIQDLILYVPVPGSSGYDQQLRNAGKMENSGIELGLTFVPLNTADVTWHSTVNYSTYKNTVTELAIKPAGAPVTGTEFIQLEGGFTGVTNVAMVGQPLGVMRGVGWLRDINGNRVYSGDTYTDKSGKQQVAEDYFGNAYKGAPLIDPELQIIGDPNPGYTFSWNNEFTLFKDFSIGFLIDASIGQKVWNGTRGALYNFGTHGDTKDRDDPWFNDRGEAVMDYSDTAGGKAPVQLTRESYYRLYANNFVGGADEAHMEDASYVKLREVHVEYRWGGLQDWGIETVTFGVSARNLHTWTNYSGYDPEVNNFQQAEGRGFDYFTLPQTRSVRFSISITY